ncbi:MAG TPA: nucleotidyl transferase AbiEii/AbiGii toxin family protein [Planctomycetota bacterium]|nr:nucleotidyl transferase AbiEii/AbiGii toxin family protein [Planctomycetota bacterium]
MARDADPLGEFFPLVNALEQKGLQPVLVGGMALVILGSQRITKDFDLMVSSTDLSQDLVEMIYRQGYQLVTKFNKAGEVERTIDNSTVAVARLRLDKPRSVFFYSWEKRLRVDLLLNFPLPTVNIAARAAKIGKRPRTLRVAAPEDLLHLKELAYADRKSAADAQDLEFLRNLLKERS